MARRDRRDRGLEQWVKREIKGVRSAFERFWRRETSVHPYLAAVYAMARELDDTDKAGVIALLQDYDGVKRNRGVVRAIIDVTSAPLEDGGSAPKWPTKSKWRRALLCLLQDEVDPKEAEALLRVETINSLADNFAKARRAAKTRAQRDAKRLATKRARTR